MVVSIAKPKAIVCDIEGTTTSLRFWSEALVPYIKVHCGTCLKHKWGTPEVMDAIEAVRQKTDRERQRGMTDIPAIASADSHRRVIRQSVVENVIYQMNNRLHNNAIKALQLVIWLYGYETGKLKGHVFSDVAKAMHEWKREDIKICTFSMAISRAQKLMFCCSVKGNLLTLIDNCFDDSIGTKTNVDSYRTIANQINVSPSEILYLSDNPRELRAAQSAGYMTLLVSRPGNRPIDENDMHVDVNQVIHNFSHIKFITNN